MKCNMRVLLRAVAVTLVGIICLVQSAGAKTVVASNTVPEQTPAPSAVAVKVVGISSESSGAGLGLVRADAQSSSLGSFSTVINPGATLSLPGNAPALAAFNRAAAQWSAFISDPITESDLRALDLIGYDIVVPEPATLLLLGAGLPLISRRRRRARSVL